MGSTTVSDAIEAVQKAEGYVIDAALALGCHPMTLFAMARRSPKLRAAIDAARELRREQRREKARQGIDGALDEAKPWAIRMVLEADPEFTPRQHHEVAGAIAITWQVHGGETPEAGE